MNRMGDSFHKRTFFEENPILSLAKAMGYLGLYLGVQSIVSLIFQTIWYADAVEKYGTGERAAKAFYEIYNRNSMLLMVVCDVLIVALVAIIMANRQNSLSRRQNRALFSKVKPSRLWFIMGMGFVLNFAITLPLSVISELLPSNVVEQYGQTQAVYNAGGLGVYFLSGVLLAPIVEELIFRGLMATRLSRAMPRWMAVLLTAVIFGAIHGSWIQGVYAGLLGLLLGTVFFREKSLFASVALHFGFNFASLIPYVIGQSETLSQSVPILLVLNSIYWISMPLGLLWLIFYLSQGSTASPLNDLGVGRAANSNVIDGSVEEEASESVRREDG